MTEEPITKCRRCHRRLKNPQSIAIGMGPVCARKAAKEDEEQTKLATDSGAEVVNSSQEVVA